MDKKLQKAELILRRDFLKMTGAAGVTLALSGCGGGSSSKSGGASSNGFTYGFPNSITDGRIFIATSKEGSVVTYFGDKDPKGNGINLRAVEVVSDAKSNLMYYDPDKKRLTRIVTSNGVSFDLEWQDANKAVVTLLHSATNTSLSTPLDFSSQVVANKTVTSNISRPSTPLRSYSSNSVNTRQAQAVNGNCVVNVSKCGQPHTSFADVFVTISKKGLNVAYASYPAYPRGNGVFVANIPTGNKKILDLKQAALQAIEAVKYVCEPFTDFNTTKSIEYFCAATAAAIASAPTGLNQVAAASFLSACTIFNAATTVSCKAISSPAGQVGTEAISQLIEKGVQNIDIDLTAEIDLTARAAALPTTIVGSTRTALITGPFPALDVSLGSETQISGFTLNPVSPAIQQPYNATVKLLCLKAGDTVMLTISGTDGYNDDETFSITQSQANQEFSLRVPGAKTSGIRDTVDVYINSNGKPQLQQTRFLVFL